MKLRLLWFFINSKDKQKQLNLKSQKKLIA